MPTPIWVALLDLKKTFDNQLASYIKIIHRIMERRDQDHRSRLRQRLVELIDCKSQKLYSLPSPIEKSAMLTELSYNPHGLVSQQHTFQHQVEIGDQLPILR
jgi:hypothetical protein